ncbi:HAD-IA family hydrolase [Tolumonas lignilytica]|uniref:HAD-IA family hydrolase n=1 Tax=Tolumonas lignilytica TaxID=1283284 RepID=UPI0004666CED|nr:HAD-IA family hydrolase [Tolumonas lignilytica]
MMCSRFSAVLFDLDGTLLDTAPDLGAAANHVLTQIGKAPLSDQVIRQTASDGALALIKAGLSEAEQTEHDLTVLRQQLLDHYAQHLYVGTRPYDGMVELIGWLNTRAIPWGVVTNKPAFLTEPLLAQVIELPQCAVTVSADTLPVRKPNPEPLWYACHQIGVSSANCLYVGDHIRDIEAGRNAGMTTAVASWGYLAQDENVSCWNADIVLADPHHLLAWLAS